MLLDLSDDFALDRSVHFEMTYCAILLMSFDNSSWQMRCINHLSLSYIELLLFGDLIFNRFEQIIKASFEKFNISIRLQLFSASIYWRISSYLTHLRIKRTSSSQSLESKDFHTRSDEDLFLSVLMICR